MSTTIKSAAIKHANCGDYIHASRKHVVRINDTIVATIHELGEHANNVDTFGRVEVTLGKTSVKESNDPNSYKSHCIRNFRTLEKAVAYIEANA